jgi:amino acid transporter
MADQVPGGTESPPENVLESRSLGTFLGVFTPSILTILGVILFLRMGWVVGNVGLMPALMIVALCHLISLATALSLSAIATNMQVGVGGAYYLISRSLGLEIGGAIGVPLFLSQVLSVTLYAFGLAESLRLLWPGLPERGIAALVVVTVSLVASRSAGLAMKIQLPVMVAIAAAMVSLAVGVGSSQPETVPLWDAVSNPVPFWVVFAVFFPAVTGIMAGVSLSGDLREPKTSIPRGTISAVLVGFAFYIAVPILLAAGADTETLAGDTLVWFKVAAVPLLIFPGLWGAILSSALGSILGAPRTLAALALDRVIPERIARPVSRRGGPTMALLISSAIAMAAVLLGDLNAVAPILTMFFLTTYGMINLVAGLEQLSSAPAYRPTVHVPWPISLAGAVACFWVMSLISPVAAVAAVFVEVGLYASLRRRSLSASWGDMRYGTIMSLVRTSLLRLRDLPVAPRNWRPNILVFAGDIDRRIDLVRFAAWLNQERGMLTVCHLVIGEVESVVDEALRRAREVQDRLDDEAITAFAEAHVVGRFESGAIAVTQAHGIGGVVSNTIMFGLSSKPERVVSTLRILRRAALLDKSTVLCKIAPRTWAPRARRIDVWWGGLERNGDMLLLFAHLLSLNPAWSTAEIAVKCIASELNPTDWSERRLAELLERSRIDARPEVIEAPVGASVQDIIHERSGDADLVLMGLRNPEPGGVEAYASRLTDLVGDLPTVIMVHAAGPFAGQLLETVEQ